METLGASDAFWSYFFPALQAIVLGLGLAWIANKQSRVESKVEGVAKETDRQTKVLDQQSEKLGIQSEKITDVAAELHIVKTATNSMHDAVVAATQVAGEAKGRDDERMRQENITSQVASQVAGLLGPEGKSESDKIGGTT